MMIETLGDAFTHSMRVWLYCDAQLNAAAFKGGECKFKSELHLMTLVATRGRGFPVSRLAQRLRCPRCGTDQVKVLFDLPANDRRRSA